MNRPDLLRRYGGPLRILRTLRALRQGLRAFARSLPGRGFAGIALLACSLAALAASHVEVVLSDASPAYQDAVAVLRERLGNAATLRVVVADAAENGAAARAAEPVLVIALGSRALAYALGQRDTPVLAALLPRHAYERAVQDAGAKAARASAVFLDQPWSRQLAFVRLVLPTQQRVGVIASADFDEGIRALRGAAQQQKFGLVVERIAPNQAIYPALARVLAESDLVLAVPDTAVFNSGTIHNILLAAFRAQQPLIGFSPAYVRAGALAALYSTPQQVAEQVAEIALRALAGAPLPPPQYPRSFSVGTNAAVARSLGLGLEPEAAIAARLQAMERER
jgi:ABC-type uncharacterized transport system substrate-binding protein